MDSFFSIYYKYIILVIYLLVILGVFLFLVIFSMHTRRFHTYSRYLTPVFNILIVIILVIMLFGAYMILSSNNSFERFLGNSDHLDFNTNSRIDY